MRAVPITNVKLLVTFLVLLALPAGAAAKEGGVALLRDAETVALGKPIALTASLLEPARGSPHGFRRLAGVRPLISFRDRVTGRIVMAHVTVSDRFGRVRGTVRFPWQGPWDTRLSVPGHRLATENGGDGFYAGVRLPMPAAAPRDRGSGSGVPWVLLPLGAALLALIASAGRRRPRLGRAGGGA
jgi:hypothetical protein